MPKSDVTAPSEAEVLRQCLDLLTLLRVKHYRNNTGAVAVAATATSRRRYVRFGVPGMPDVVAVGPRGGRHAGKFIGIEVKAPGGRLRPEQAAVIDNLRADEALAFVVRSAAELHEALTKEGVIP